MSRAFLLVLLTAGCLPSFETIECLQDSDCAPTQVCVARTCARPDDAGPADSGVDAADSGSTASDAAEDDTGLLDTGTADAGPDDSGPDASMPDGGPDAGPDPVDAGMPMDCDALRMNPENWGPTRSYVTTPMFQLLPPYAVETWLLVERPTDRDGMVLSKECQFELELNSAGEPEFRYRVDCTQAFAQLSGAPLTVGEWHHVAATVGIAGSALFVDGQQVDTQPVGLTPNVADATIMTIGDLRAGTPNSQLSGAIAAVRLTEGSTMPPPVEAVLRPAPNTRLLYDFSPAPGTTVLDESTNGLDGAVVGQSLVRYARSGPGCTGPVDAPRAADADCLVLLQFDAAPFGTNGCGPEATLVAVLTNLIDYRPAFGLGASIPSASSGVNVSTSSVGPPSTIEMLVKPLLPGVLYSDRSGVNSGPGVSVTLQQDQSAAYRGGIVVETENALGQTSVVTSDVGSLAFGVWQHVAVTVESQRVSIFIDGLDRTPAGPQTVRADVGSANHFFGGQPGAAGFELDDARVSRGVRSF